MPANSQVQFDQIFLVLKNKIDDVFDSETRLFKSPNDKCWIDVKNQLNFNISVKYLYLIVKENRHDIAKKLGILNEVSIIKNESKTESSEESSGNDEDALKLDDKLNFKITLSNEEWAKMYDSSDFKMYKRSDGKNLSRAYQTLKPYEWTSIIHDYFYALTKLPCKISYKRSKVYPSGAVFLKIHGKCTECSSDFNGVVNDQPEHECKVIIYCTYSGNFKNCKCHKKRRIIGDKYEELKKKLVNENQSAAYVQRIEAKNTMTYGDPEPSNLPSKNALRIMKYKTLKEDQINSDPIIALSVLKSASPYNTIIRDISYDKFFVHYWAITEINSYRHYVKNSIISRITIDATGGVVKKPTLISGRKTSHIFLYQIGVRDAVHGCQFSVGHMLSEKHDSNTISYWLTEWLRNKIPHPKIIITDQSLALMMAVVKTFTEYSCLTKYISVCSSLILKEPGVKVPSSMIRNDFNHVMHILSTWPELKDGSYRVKNFYLRSIGLIISSVDYSDIKTLLRHIFTVCLHETDGFNANGLPTQCEISKMYLKRRIATHNMIELDDFLSSEKAENKLINEDDSHTLSESLNITIFEDFKLIYEKVIEQAESDDGNHDNMQFNPSIGKKLLNFCKLIPCWSAIMVPIFKYGDITESSTTSESLFNDLKTNVFKHKTLPLRMDQFLKIHINSIIGSMNMIGSQLGVLEENTDNEPSSTKVLFKDDKEKNDMNESNKSSKCYSSDENEFNLNIEKQDSVENWKGLGEEPKKRKGNYLEKDPNVLFYKDHSKSKSSVIGILKNGNFSDLKPISIDKFNYTFTNTCAFDSIIHILCSSYVESHEYSLFIEREKTQGIFKLISDALRDGINAQTYRKRANILIDITKGLRPWIEHPSGLRHLDCSSTVEYMIRQIFANYPSLVTIGRCTNCSYNKKRKTMPISVILPTENLDFLSDALLAMYPKSTQKCNECKMGNIEHIYNYGSHLFIEPYVQITKNKITKQCLDLTICLHNIPKQLTLQEKMYHLRGIINFIPPMSKSLQSVGHYVTYNWRSTTNKWEKYDDLSTSARVVRPNSIANNCQIIMYTE